MKGGQVKASVQGTRTIDAAKSYLYSNVLVRRNRNGERRIIEIVFF
jgi:hypothetical protein